MYDKNKAIVIPLGTSASGLYGNLSACGSRVACVHKNRAVVLDDTTGKGACRNVRLATGKDPTVFEARYVNVGEEPVLVVGSTVGLTIFSENGTKELASFPIPDSAKVESNSFTNFVRGIAGFSCSAGSVTVVAGTASGKLMVVTKQPGAAFAFDRVVRQGFNYCNT
jgi:hypothetical protein